MISTKSLQHDPQVLGRIAMFIDNVKALRCFACTNRACFGAVTQRKGLVLTQYEVENQRGLATNITIDMVSLDFRGPSSGLFNVRFLEEVRDVTAVRKLIVHVGKEDVQNQARLALHLTSLGKKFYIDHMQLHLDIDKDLPNVTVHLMHSCDKVGIITGSSQFLYRSAAAMRDGDSESLRRVHFADLVFGMALNEEIPASIKKVISSHPLVPDTKCTTLLEVLQDIYYMEPHCLGRLRTTVLNSLLNYVYEIMTLSPDGLHNVGPSIHALQWRIFTGPVVNLLGSDNPWDLQWFAMTNDMVRSAVRDTSVVEQFALNKVAAWRMRLQNLTILACRLVEWQGDHVWSRDKGTRLLAVFLDHATSRGWRLPVQLFEFPWASLKTSMFLPIAVLKLMIPAVGLPNHETLGRFCWLSPSQRNISENVVEHIVSHALLSAISDVCPNSRMLTERQRSDVLGQVSDLISYLVSQRLFQDVVSTAGREHAFLSMATFLPRQLNYYFGDEESTNVFTAMKTMMIQSALKAV